jgi:predicted HD superfamily hydrolase involved in NAD metabolism
MPDENYLVFVQTVNTPKRLQHSLGVMQVMGELAGVYGLDKDQAETLGLLHDAAKDLSPALIEQLIREGKIEIHFECENDYVYYLHGPVGSYFVQKELSITDNLILGAITAHTYCGNGEHFNHPLTWCLRFADILEPTRNWSRWQWLNTGVENLRTMAYAGRLEESAYLLTSMLIKWFPDLDIPVHPHTRHVNQELAAQLNLDSSFLEKYTQPDTRSSTKE